MVGSATTNYWVDDGKVTLNPPVTLNHPPARLLDESGQWIPSTMGPVVNTLAYLGPACEVGREEATIPLQISTPRRPLQNLAYLPESEDRRQRGISRIRRLRESQLHSPTPLNTAPGTQRGNTVGKSSPFVSSRRIISTSVHNFAPGLRHPMIHAPLFGIGRRHLPQVRLTTVHPALPVRRIGPIAGSRIAAHQPTPALAPRRIYNRSTYRQFGNTKRRYEYPSPPRQSSYYTAGTDSTPFPGPYFLSREEVYNNARWQEYPALPPSLSTAAIDRTRENYTFPYIGPATSPADLLIRPFPHDNENEADQAHASFHISCEHCGSQSHFTNECPYMPAQ